MEDDRSPKSFSEPISGLTALDPILPLVLRCKVLLLPLVLRGCISSVSPAPSMPTGPTSIPVRTIPVELSYDFEKLVY
jgi:hypothetical protein